MYISGIEITEAIRKMYKWVYIPRLDKNYFLPSRDFIMVQIISASMKDLNWRPETCDCDNIALILCGKIKERECVEKWEHCMPFGVTIGKLADGRKHMMNCFYSQSGFEFYDALGMDIVGFKPSMILM